jgi:hypothetical protein
MKGMGGLWLPVSFWGVGWFVSLEDWSDIFTTTFTGKDRFTNAVKKSRG